MTTWVYEFEDGTKLELLNIGLSVEEIWKLKELHGDVKKSFKRIGGIYEVSE